MTRRQRLTILATGLGMFMVFLDALIVNIALPDIQSDFGVGESGAQAVVTAYSIGMAITIMWSATLADLRGRRRVYVAAVVVFCAASLLSGLAPNFEVLVIGRAAQGLAAGPITVASLALLSAAFTDDSARAHAVGLWTGIGAVGTAVGPTLGGVMTDEFGWRSVFIVNLPIGVAIVFLSLAAVAESTDPTESRSFDHLGNVEFAVAIAAFATAIIAAPQQGWVSAPVLGLFAVSIVALAAFVRRELRLDDPMMDLTLFSNGLYSLSLAALFIFFFMGYGTLLIVTQYFQNVRGFSTLEAGLLILPFAIGFITMSPNARRISERLGRRRALLTALVGGMLGLATVAVGLTLEPWVVGAGMLLTAWSNALAIVPLTGLSMSTVSADRSGMASGIMGTQRALGSTTGYAVMGSVMALWVGAKLDDRLAGIVTNEGERQAIGETIIDQANPNAFVAELGPAQPLGVIDATEQAEIVAVADDTFVTGMQVALGVAIAVMAVMLVVSVLRFPSDEPTTPEV